MALGHFHERVGESPRSYENFGTSGSKKSRFVSEIRPCKVGIAVRPNFTNPGGGSGRCASGGTLAQQARSGLSLWQKGCSSLDLPKREQGGSSDLPN